MGLLVLLAQQQAAQALSFWTPSNYVSYWTSGMSTNQVLPVDSRILQHGQGFSWNFMIQAPYFVTSKAVAGNASQQFFAVNLAAAFAGFAPNKTETSLTLCIAFTNSSGFNTLLQTSPPGNFAGPDVGMPVMPPWSLVNTPGATQPTTGLGWCGIVKYPDNTNASTSALMIARIPSDLPVVVPPNQATYLNIWNAGGNGAYFTIQNVTVAFRATADDLPRIPEGWAPPPRPPPSPPSPTLSATLGRPGSAGALLSAATAALLLALVLLG